MTQEFFYHSFSRKLKNETKADNYERSFKTLESILRNGILFAPEEIEMPFKLKDPLKPIVQHRVCFTLIAREKLNEHTQLFGEFSLEFETAFLRKIGIMPTMYLPIFNYTDSDHLQNVSSKFVYRLINFHQQARKEFDDVKLNLDKAYYEKNLDKIKYLNSRAQELLEKRAWFEGLSNMIYPIDNNFYTPENGYYLQREWKLPANLILNGKDVTEIATTEQQQELLRINKVFFSKEINYLGERIPRSKISFFLKLYENQHILNYANKIIIPKEWVSQVKTLLEKYQVNLQIDIL